MIARASASTAALSWQTVRRSWPPYVGAFVALASGTFLIAVSVGLVASVDATSDALPVTRETRAQLSDLSSAFGIMASISLFLALFVVASTFGFMVATRQRELGLLRLIGATPKQVRRTVQGEAAVVTLLATVVGCLAGTVAMPVVFHLVRAIGFTDLDLVAAGPGLAWAVAAPLGAVVALLGVRRAAKRAAKVSPSAALHEARVERRRPGAWQLVVFVLCLAGLVAVVVVAPHMPPLAALIVAVFLPELVVVALVSVGGVVFPWLAAKLARPFVGLDVAARLARDQVRTAVRLPAALAAPVLAISAIAGSLILTMSFTADWNTGLNRERLAAPLVVDLGSASAGDADEAAAAVAAAPEVAVADVRRSVAARVDAGDGGDSARVQVVDVGAAGEARRLEAVSGDLDGLADGGIAVSEQWLFDLAVDLGDTLRVTVGGRTARLPVVAVLPDAPDLYGDLVVAAGTLDESRAVTDAVFVVPVAGLSATDARHALASDVGTAAPGGRVIVADAWLDGLDSGARSANAVALVVLLGPASGYAAIAIVNAVLIGVSQRGPQLRTARLLGATPGQVRRAVAWEAGLVGGAALVAGGGITLLVGWIIRQAIARDVADAALTVPWAELAGVVGACAVLVLAAAAAGARATTRTQRG